MERVRRLLKVVSAGISSGFYALMRFLHACAMVAAGVMAAVVITHVTMRYVFKAPFGFGQELAILLMFIVVFAAVPELFVRGQHLRIEVVANRLPPKVNRWVELFVTALGSLFMLFFSWYLARLVLEMYSRQLHYHMMPLVPRWPQYALAALAIVLASLVLLSNLFKAAKTRQGSHAQGEE